MSLLDWNIQSRGHVCHSCKKHFVAEEAYHTVLVDQKHIFERQDVCEACWRSQFEETATDRKGFVSYWQGVYHVPPSGPVDAIQKETAETLLRKLVEQQDPAHSAACFILAVMLERKRIFKVKAQLTQEGKRVFIYEHTKSGDLFKIVDPDLHLHQLEEVQKDVSHLLAHGVGGNAAAAPAPEKPVPAGEKPAEGPAVAVTQPTANSP